MSLRLFASSALSTLKVSHFNLNSYSDDLYPEVLNTVIDLTVSQTLEEIRREEREVVKQFVHQ